MKVIKLNSSDGLLTIWVAEIEYLESFSKQEGSSSLHAVVFHASFMKVIF